MDGQVVNGRSMQVGEHCSRTRIASLAVGLPSSREAKVSAQVLLSDPIDRSIAVRWLLPLQVVRRKSAQLRLGDMRVSRLYHILFVHTF